eukprot:1442388-Pyramimonas_sp.AAC.1
MADNSPLGNRKGAACCSRPGDRMQPRLNARGANEAPRAFPRDSGTTAAASSPPQALRCGSIRALSWATQSGPLRGM